MIRALKAFTGSHNESGQSLVGIMIAAGLMSITMMIFLSMITAQQRETRAITEKLASLELENLLFSMLANGSVCTAEIGSSQFNPGAPYHINTTNLSAASINLTSLHASAAASAPTLITVNGTVSPNSPNLKVSAIAVTNFTSTGTPDQYLADVKISFDTSKVVRPLKPLLIKTQISTDSSTPPTAKKILSCQSAAATSATGGGEQEFTSNGTFQVPAGVRVLFVTAVGGGGGGGGGRAFGFDVNIGASGGGGGGGQYVEQKIVLLPANITSVPVTIGNGGLGGAAGGGNGADGGTTSFGSYLSLSGGKRGTGASATYGPIPGGTGGTPGGKSQRGEYVYPCYVEAGQNGDSMGAFSGGTLPTISTHYANESACCYGASGGGGGASVAGNGGNGGSCTGPSSGGNGQNGGYGAGGGGGGTSYGGWTPGKGGNGGSGYLKVVWIE